ncbi:MAG: hypothetical protein ACI4GD_00525 [Lachnospiraceae bacterium]
MYILMDERELIGLTKMIDNLQNELDKRTIWQQLDTQYATHDYFGDVPACDEIKVEVYEVDNTTIKMAGDVSINVSDVMSKYGQDISISKNINYGDYTIPIKIECKSSVHEMPDGNLSGHVSYITGTMPSEGTWYMMAYYK